MPDVYALNNLIDRYTTAYRKEAETVRVERVGDVTVVHVNGYPEAPSRGDLVDVHFLRIGFTEAAADRDTFDAALKVALDGQGVFADISETRFGEGPSYIEVGGWLGDQDRALRLFALLKHYGYGEVVTPATLGMSGEDATLLAGNGFVMGTLRSGWDLRGA